MTLVEPSEPMVSGREWGRWLVLITVIGLMIVLRGPWLAREAVFVDETSTHKRVLLSFQETLRTEQEPLNTVVGKAFLSVTAWTGIPEGVLLRIPQFFFSLTVLVMVVYWTNALGGALAALLAGLLMVFSPQFAAHSAICRYYPMLALLGLCLCSQLLRACGPRSRWFDWLAVALVMLAGTMNHAIFLPFSASVLAGCGFGLLITRGIDLRTWWRTLLGLLFAGMLFTLLWLVLYPSRLTSVLGSVFRIGGMHASRPPWPRYQLGLGQYLSMVFGDTGLLPFPGICLGLLGALLLGCGLFQLWRRDRLLLFIFTGVLIFPTPFFFIETSHSWAERYFIAQAPVLALIIGLGLGSLFRRMESRRIVLVLFGMLLVVGLGGYRIAVERHTVVEGIRDPLAQFAARLREMVPPDRNPILCVPDHLEWFRPASLNSYLNRPGGRFSDPSGETKSKRYNVKYTREPKLIPYLLDKKKGLTWVVVPGGAHANDKNPETIHQSQESLQFIRATMKMEDAGFQLWCYKPIATADGLWFEESEFLPNTPGVSYDGGAKVITPEKDPHGNVVELYVPADAPLEPADGRPCPTVWFNKTISPALSAAIGKSPAPPRYAFTCSIKHQAFQEGANPKRSLCVILRQGKEWKTHVILAKRQSGKDVAADEPWVDWEPVGTTFKDEEVAGRPEKIVFGIGNRGGTGRVWIDNVRVEILFPPDNPMAAPTRP